MVCVLVGLAPCCHYTAAKGLSLQTLTLSDATRHLFKPLSSFIFHFANSGCFLATYSITLLLCFVAAVWCLQWNH